jgi:hypothetical protein
MSVSKGHDVHEPVAGQMPGAPLFAIRVFSTSLVAAAPGAGEQFAFGLSKRELRLRRCSAGRASRPC